VKKNFSVEIDIVVLPTDKYKYIYINIYFLFGDGFGILQINKFILHPQS